ncbi:RUSD4 synthase, partial [Rhinopomastus cyanomelas]|nr:RUSD4 synthase [Rhinopomastus cyanomelas]
AASGSPWRRIAAVLGRAGLSSSSSSTAAAPRAEELAERVRSKERREELCMKAKSHSASINGVLFSPQVPKDPVRRQLLKLAMLSEQLQQVHPNVLAKVLKQGTVYQNEEIVVINKPYGLPVHGGPGVKNCIADVLPILAKMLENMKAEPLHLCHRLDKETTGLMVLARTQEVAERVRLLFKTRQVEKIYWAISLGEPEPTEGIVDIPIVEKKVESHQSHYKMTLAPSYRMSPDDGKMIKIHRNTNAKSAVTRYRLLASSSACSLLEVQPITGVKHQIRVHLAYGLGCTILGDHKYSHWSKLAPQKLPVITLKRLKLDQTKARYLPLHLHAYRLSLPLGERINLVCKPPLFFQKTLKKLELEAA